VSIPKILVFVNVLCKDAVNCEDHIAGYRRVNEYGMLVVSLYATIISPPRYRG